MDGAALSAKRKARVGQERVRRMRAAAGTGAPSNHRPLDGFELGGSELGVAAPTIALVDRFICAMLTKCVTVAMSRSGSMGLNTTGWRRPEGLMIS